MDNKPLEKQAESFIKSQLLRFGFKVHDLSFDEDGSDLMISKKTSEQKLKFINIQCKGRNVTNSTTSVKIPKSYVQNNFLLFVYTISQETKESLFLFFPKNIRSWNENERNEYVLNITKAKLNDNYFLEKIFNQTAAKEIETLLSSSEPKEYTSVFIDGVFLEKAVRQTIGIYSEIWPEKKLAKPSLKDIVRNILEAYNRYKNEKTIINCNVFISESFDLEKAVDIDYKTQRILSKNGNQIRIIFYRSNDIIALEILDEIDRVIEKNNILLVANDEAYGYDLSELKEKGCDIIVIRSNLKDGNEMLSEFRWGDISWPIGLSLGLTIGEL